jgi:general secretion pathway protein G
MRVWERNTSRGLKGTADPNPPSPIRHSRAGFTLIELMLVLVILATLAAIVTPRLTGQSKRAKIIAAQSQIAQFGTALDAFEIACGRYPTTSEGMLALLQAPADLPDWNGPYLNKNVVPLDPWGNEYQYRCPGQYNPDGYDLYCYGPDGSQGGDDDITNWSEEVRK